MEIKRPATPRATQALNGRQRTIITPEEAKFLISKNPNPHNRNLSEALVKKYADDMKAGRWVYNSVDTAIALDKDMGVWNGHHRLCACIKAGVPFEVDVVYNVDPTTMFTVDIGKPRTSGNILQMAGIPNGNQVAAIAGWVLVYEAGKIKTHERPTKSEIVQRVLADGEALQRSFAAVSLSQKIASATLLGFCHYVFEPQDPDKCWKFFEEIRTGEMLSTGNPVRHLRERLIDERRAKAKLPMEHLIAMCFKAWLIYRAGKSMAHLRLWRSDGPNPEAFPDISIRQTRLTQ